MRSSRFVGVLTLLVPPCSAGIGLARTPGRDRGGLICREENILPVRRRKEAQVWHGIDRAPVGAQRMRCVVSGVARIRARLMEARGVRRGEW